MSGMDVIEAKDLTRTFRLFDSPGAFLKELFSGKRHHRTLTALDHITFTIASSEIVGLIGPNGAGKSTLVRVLTGILPLSSGQLSVKGRIKAVNELGIGFHVDYTGYDNIVMGGLALGYSRAEIESRRDWITQFSELGDALSRPLSTYSAGMKARLGFCVAFCQVPEVLIVDEALSVGDAAFSAKCTGFLQDICRRDGRTVIMVSHNMDLIRRICSRAVYINGGRLVADGHPDDVVNRYEADAATRFIQVAADVPVLLSETSPRNFARANLPEAVRRTLEDGGAVLKDEVRTCPFLRHLGLLKLVTLDLLDADGRPVTTIESGAPITFRAVIDSQVQWPGLVAGFQITGEHGNLVSSVNSCWSLGDGRINEPVKLDLDLGRYEMVFRVSHLSLGAGHYLINFGVSSEDTVSEESKLLFERSALAFAVIRRDFAQHVYYEPLGEWSFVPLGAEGLVLD